MWGLDICEEGGDDDRREDDAKIDRVLAFCNVYPKSHPSAQCLLKAAACLPYTRLHVMFHVKPLTNLPQPVDIFRQMPPKRHGLILSAVWFFRLC